MHIAIAVAWQRLPYRSIRRLTVIESPLTQLPRLGQSVWLDYIRRDLMAHGELRRLIQDDGLRGMTSNPAIFEKAILGSREYDGEVTALARAGKDATQIYEAISQRDVQTAADQFRQVYYQTGGKDGYVSLEVDPHLAHDTQGTIREARRLWAALGRPNVFIKVPATSEGLPAIERLICEGININVTLLFGLPRYREVAEAYLAGIEARLEEGHSIDHVASVASFFVSRIDTLVDSMLEEIITQDPQRAELAKSLHGRVATSSAKAAYQIYRETFAGDRFGRLADRGGRTQRLLWASTSTKNPLYSDVKYVDELVGADTVTTLPVETLVAYRDHGDPRTGLDQGLEQAQGVLRRLREVGIRIDEVTAALEDEGVDKFTSPFDKLMETLEKERVAALQSSPAVSSLQGPE
jgi:transaldolase